MPTVDRYGVQIEVDANGWPVGGYRAVMLPQTDSDGFPTGNFDAVDADWLAFGIRREFIARPEVITYEVPVYSEGVQTGSVTIIPDAIDYRSVNAATPQMHFYMPTQGVPGSPVGSGNYYLIAEKLRTGGINDWGESPAFNFATIEPNSMYGFRGQAGVNAVTDRLQRKYGATIQAAIDAEIQSGG